MRIVIIMLFLMAEGSAILLRHSLVEEVGRVVGVMLEATSLSTCSLILIDGVDGVASSYTIPKAVSSERSSPRGMTVMKVTADGQDANVTLEQLSHLVGQARRIRRESWCVTVVLVSHDTAFLTAFAESSLKGRLLVWAIRLLVVTSLSLQEIQALLPSHWTFSMMNTIFLNLENTQSNLSVSVYTHLPYSKAGPRVVRVASWSPERGLLLLTRFHLFHEKYDDFQGASIPASVLPFPPYWVEEDHQTADGTTVRRISGTDGELALSLARALNFTFQFLPIRNWAEVLKTVEERIALITPVYFTVLPQRLELFDMTYPYEFSFLAFSMKKPGLKPRWQSLYYPLADQVWAAVLAVLLCVPVVLIMILRIGERTDGISWTEAGVVVQDTTGMLLGQNLPRRLPSTNSSRLLVAAWLVFAFIIGTVYRGNLTAHLTLPKYPPRPETIEQLVEAVDKITGPSYQAPFKDFYLKSSNKVYQKLGQLFVVGLSVIEGLQQALEHNQAVIEGRRYLEHIIAENFTEPDGSTKFYLGQEYILPGMSAWPIPHDAPYRSQIDRYTMLVIQAGLYEKWSSDQMAKARRKSSKRQREYLALQQRKQQEEGERTESGTSIKALTLTHMQGPLMLLFLGHIIAGLAFTINIFVHLQHTVS